jgi:hypothetical protein
MTENWKPREHRGTKYDEEKHRKSLLRCNQLSKQEAHLGNAQTTGLKPTEEQIRARNVLLKTIPQMDETELKRPPELLTRTTGDFVVHSKKRYRGVGSMVQAIRETFQAREENAEPTANQKTWKMVQGATRSDSQVGRNPKKQWNILFVHFLAITFAVCAIIPLSVVYLSCSGVSTPLIAVASFSQPIDSMINVVLFVGVGSEATVLWLLFFFLVDCVMKHVLESRRLGPWRSIDKLERTKPLCMLRCLCFLTVSSHFANSSRLTSVCFVCCPFASVFNVHIHCFPCVESPS